MSLFSRDGLVISLPGTELEAIDLPGSVCEPEAVLSQPVSLELRAALMLVLRACRRRHVPVKMVARPEIFTHGAGERWLRERLGAVSQHLCVTDGATIKTIAGCQTHIFFYRLGLYDNYRALQRLSARAPELVTAVRSQINTAQTLGVGEDSFVPQTVYLTETPNFPRPTPRLLPFFLNPHSAEDSAARIEQRGEVSLEQLPDHQDIVYLPLTETAMHDRSFARFVAKAIVDGFFSADTLLILRLPPVAAQAGRLVAQISGILPQLRGTHITIPRNCPPGVVLATDDLIATSPILAGRPWTMLVHESFDFWRYPRPFYRAAQRVMVMGSSGSTAPGGFLPADVQPIFGDNAQRVWLRRVDQD